MGILTDISSAELRQLIERNFDRVKKSVKIENIRCKDRFDFDWPEKIDLQFNGCEFREPAIMYSIPAESSLTFNHCSFLQELELDGPTERVTLKVTFSTLNNGFTIRDAKGIKLFMGRTEGKGSFSFDDVEFELCSFSGFTATGTTSEDQASFHNCVFTHCNFKEAVLQNASFNNACFVNHAQFDKAKLNYTATPGAGNFFNVVFEGDAYFNGTDFNLGAMFNGASFKGLAVLVGCNLGHFECVGDFSGCSFEKRAFFDDSKFEALLFNHVLFKEITSFNAVKCHSLTLNKTIFLQSADFLDTDIQKASRETFRAIKNEFLKNNNAVEGQLYHAKEMRVYEKNITLGSHPKEKIVLWFNKISNDFGCNWLRGALFTFVSGIVFYCLYLLTLGDIPVSFGWNGWPEFWQALNLFGSYFVKFFIVTHELDFMSFACPGAMSYLLDFVGRIFIGYGIFQTIQAFRKYGK